MITHEAQTFRTSDKREFTFLFDFDGLIAAEDCANGPAGTANLKQIIGGALNGRLGYLRALVYGGLKAHHPEITREAATALIDSDGKALGAALWPALFGAMPVPEAKGDAENPPQAASGTGTRSSPRGSKKGSTKRASAGRRRGATRPS